MTALYDEIGRSYADYRRPDPRIAAQIARALHDVGSVVNLGAGAGSYEPRARDVVAVEPSAVMIAQRAPGAAPAVRACAERLPFADGAFDAATAFLTLHHWGDAAGGLREAARVSRRRVVLLTWIGFVEGFWLMDYLPEIAAFDAESFMSLAEIEGLLGPLRMTTVPIPHDCTDGFLCAYWRRPHAYLDAGVRGAISAFSRVPDLEPGIARLRHDLASGAWHARYAQELAGHARDFGYRLVVAERA